MRTTLLFLLVCSLLLSFGACRKPGYDSRTPCEDPTLASLTLRKASLTPGEMTTYDSLTRACEKYTAEHSNQGKLWPWLLAGVVAVFAVGVAILWLLLPHKEETY